jgi:hypothetical protein
VSRRHTTETFILAAQKIHGNKYDYSRVRYEGYHSKIEIVCPKEGHGVFIQKPNSHLCGRGCRVCGRQRREDATRSTTEQFIKEAQKIHGNKYSYSKFVYRSRNTKGLITCAKHGDFEQIAADHLRYGCQKCGWERNASRKRKSLEKFIHDARTVHDDAYDYSWAIIGPL